MSRETSQRLQGWRARLPSEEGAVRAEILLALHTGSQDACRDLADALRAELHGGGAPADAELHRLETVLASRRTDSPRVEELLHRRDRLLAEVTRLRAEVTTLEAALSKEVGA